MIAQVEFKPHSDTMRAGSKLKKEHLRNKQIKKALKPFPNLLMSRETSLRETERRSREQL